MRSYFQHPADCDDGEGVVYFEICDGYPVRQVEVYQHVWRWGDEQHPEHLADQPIEVLDLEESMRISADVFERLWAEARRRVPAGR